MAQTLTTSTGFGPTAFLRLWHWEIMAELQAPLLSPTSWFRPSSLKTEGGDWLAWCGPLHVAVSRHGER